MPVETPGTLRCQRVTEVSIRRFTTFSPRALGQVCAKAVSSALQGDGQSRGRLALQQLVGRVG